MLPWSSPIRAKSCLALFLLVGAPLSVGCGGDAGVSLRIDLRTDYQPERRFSEVEVAVLEPLDDGSRMHVREVTVDADAMQDYLDGVRIASMEGLREGAHYLVRVRLIDQAGAPAAERAVEVLLRGNTAVTTVISVSCREVTCPGEGDEEDATACSGGRCVPADCRPEEPETCPAPACEADSDCPAASDCTRGVCVAGECLLRADDARCGADEICDAENGCLLRPGLDGGPPEMDAGPACPTMETTCDDGEDEDCDGLTDCEDPDCTEQLCAPMEATDWGSCGGFEEPCGNDGEETREVTTYSCAAGACAAETTTESRPCTRNTDGDTCGSTQTGNWGSCGGYSDACDRTGTRSRTITSYACDAGSCASSTSQEQGSCSRTVDDGKSCGTNRACCNGTCRSMTSNTTCGACRVDCSAIGLTCQSTGSGGYSCRGCTTNAMCQSEYASSTTCWSPTGSNMWCRCQCPTDGTVCPGAGCGSGFYCHDAQGSDPNFCSRNP